MVTDSVTMVFRVPNEELWLDKGQRRLAEVFCASFRSKVFFPAIISDPYRNNDGSPSKRSKKSLPCIDEFRS